MTETETTTQPVGKRAAAAAEKARLEAEGLRVCVGSERFGLPRHTAPINEFPFQPSQPDGIGRMCHEHWNTYTAGLAKDRRTANGETAPAPRAKAPAKPKPTKKAAAEAAKAQVRREAAKPKRTAKPKPQPANPDGYSLDSETAPGGEIENDNVDPQGETAEA
jgi:hypothetical protein